MTDNEYKEIVKEIDFEEKWLRDVWKNRYNVSTTDIGIAMDGIRRIVSNLKEKRNEIQRF